MEYYSASKRKDILTHSTTWIIPEDIMVSENKPDTKDKHCMIYLYEIPRAVNFTETQRRTVVARGKGEGGMGN